MAGISVVIPTLDEAPRLAALLPRLRAVREFAELLVVDAASGDGSAAVAAAHGARVLAAPRRCRAAQLNAGAAAARGRILLFLHADTVPHPSAGRSIHRALRDPRVLGGAFRRRFAGAGAWLRLTCGLADLRCRLSGLSPGDQAQFVRAEVFRALGGFAEQPRMEDLDLARQLARRGRLALLGPPVLSSARRFARGAVRVSLRDAVTAGRRLAGLDGEGVAA